MGWSATDAACKMLEALEDKCFKLSGTRNAFVTARGKFIIEVGPEQDDGSIRGDIIDYFTGRVVGNLHIAPDGELIEAPHIKRLMK